MGAFFESREESFVAWRAPGFAFAPHLHSQVELLRVARGSVAITVRECMETLSAGAMAAIFPNQIHSYAAPSVDCQVEMVIADAAYAGAYLDILTRQHPASPFLTPDQLHPNAVYAMEELLREWYESGPAGEVYGPLLQLILARMIPQLRLHPNRSSDQQGLVWRIAEYISQHYRDPLTLEDLARAIGMNRYGLSRVFSEKMGQSFPSYLSSVRLSHARTLLLETDASVTEIGEESGFTSQRTFFRAFKQQFCVSPMEMRRGMER